MVDDDVDANTVADGEAMKGQLHILIDNGSTHNFVQPEVLEKMKLPITTMKQFKVYIESGETLLCENLCLRVKLDIQGLSMEVDMYVLSMKGSDIMLIIQWLQKLGKVTHEYLQQTMEFILGEMRYTLQGDESLGIKRIRLHHT
nr:retrotransposon-related protein [Tanacetum cinerariifolium]